MTKQAVYRPRKGVVIRFGDVLRIRPEMYDFDGNDYPEDIRAMFLAVEGDVADVVVLRGHEDWQIDEMEDEDLGETVYRTLEVATAQMSMWWEKDPEWR